MQPEQLAEIFLKLKEKAPVLYEELEKQLVKNAEGHGIKIEHGTESDKENVD